MPSGLYFTAVVSSFFFILFRRPISEVTERISTNLDTYLIMTASRTNLVHIPPGIYPPPAGAKPRFWGSILNFDRTYLCNGTRYQQSEKFFVNLQGRPYMPTNLVNFGPKTVSEFLLTRQNFRIERHFRPCRMDVIITDSRQTLARILCSSTGLLSRTTECRAGSRWALPCIGWSKLGSHVYNTTPAFCLRLITATQSSG